MRVYRVGNLTFQLSDEDAQRLGGVPGEEGPGEEGPGEEGPGEEGPGEKAVEPANKSRTARNK